MGNQSREPDQPHPSWAKNYDKWLKLLEDLNFKRFIGSKHIVEYFLINGNPVHWIRWDPVAKTGKPKTRESAQKLGKGVESRDEFWDTNPDAIAHYTFFSWKDDRGNQCCCDLYYHQDEDLFDGHLKKYITKAFDAWSFG